MYVHSYLIPSMTGHQLYDGPSRLQEAGDLHSVYDFWDNGRQVLFIVSQAQSDLYHMTSRSQFLLNVSMQNRWKLTITSSSASPFPLQQSFYDTSRKPPLDLRCMDACDMGTDGDALLVAMGVGRTVFLVLGRCLGSTSAHWQQHAIFMKSDVMNVSIGVQTHRDATLLVGTRAGVIHSYTISTDDLLRVDSPAHQYAFKSHGSVCHLSFVQGPEFVCAYSNGDLLLGDITRMHCKPTRVFRGHCNHFRQGLVRIDELTQGFSVDPSRRLLACAGDDYRVRIWSLDESEPLACLVSPSDLRSHEFPSLITALQWCVPATDTTSLNGSLSELCLALGCESHLPCSLGIYYQLS